METVTKEGIMSEFKNEIDVMVLIAEKNGATIARNKEGQVEDIFFTVFDLLRFADFLVTTTLENYDEIQDPKAV